MDETAIRELHKAGMEIGGHSHHHIRLGEVEESRAIRELRMSKEILDDLLQEESTVHGLALWKCAQKFSRDAPSVRLENRAGHLQSRRTPCSHAAVHHS